MNKIQTILSFAMRMEKDAEDFYSYYMDKAKSNTTRELFRELAGMENQHYNILKSRFDKLGFTEPPLAISWVVDNSFASKDPHVLTDNSSIAGDAESELSDLSIIRMAYLIENDFSLFYKHAVEAVDDTETKKLLNELSAWEDGHRSMFREKYQSLLKKHWSDITSIIFAE